MKKKNILGFTLTKAERTESGFTLTKAERTESGFTLMNKASERSERGFTLIELLVVITILGILATIGLVSFRTSQMRSRDAQRKSDLRQLSSALEIYYNDYERYPGANGGKVLGCPTDPPTACNWSNDSIFQDDKTTYMRSMPEDPANGLIYYYAVDSDLQGYKLYAHLENTQDTSIDSTIEVPCGTNISCNFVIEKSNEL